MNGEEGDYSLLLFKSLGKVQEGWGVNKNSLDNSPSQATQQTLKCFR